jgi:predicted amidohydrolase
MFIRKIRSRREREDQNEPHGPGMDLLIRNGRVVDPASRTDGNLDLFIVDGRIADVRAGIRADAARTIDASGLIVAPRIH